MRKNEGKNNQNKPKKCEKMREGKKEKYKREEKKQDGKRKKNEKRKRDFDSFAFLWQPSEALPHHGEHLRHRTEFNLLSAKKGLASIVLDNTP